MTDTTEHDPIVGDTPAHLLPDANAIVGEFDKRLRL